MSKTKLGLFADGIVGDRVLSIILEHCPEALSYVVIPSWDSPLAKRWVRDSHPCPVLSWDDSDVTTDLPRLFDSVPDVIVLAWWPYIVNGAFLKSGQKATLNMHPSLLPHGRGKDPNFWALAEREPFGVTIHHVDEGVDTGDIAFQVSIPTSWEDTGASLYERAQTAMADLFSTSLDSILSLSIPRIAQDRTRASFHRRADLVPRSWISLDAPSTCRELLNVLRARTFPPHPACRFTDSTGTYQVRIKIEKIKDEHDPV